MSDTSKTFSQKLQRLEEIVRLLERPDVELEDGLKLLEEGVALHQECQKMLTQTQAKIHKLLDASDSSSLSDAEQSAPPKPQPIEATEGTLFEAVEIEASVKHDDDEDLPF